MENTSKTELMNLESHRKTVKLRYGGFAIFATLMMAMTIYFESPLSPLGLLACLIGVTAFEAIVKHADSFISMRDQIENMRAEIAELRAAQGTD
jgi:hypothetical protein